MIWILDMSISQIPSVIVITLKESVSILPNNCWVNLASQNVLSKDGTLSLTHSVSRKVFRPKLATNWRLAETVWITELKFKSLISYSGDLNTELVWFLNGRKEVGCQIVWFFNAIWIQDSATIWMQDKWTPSCFLMFWSGIRMVSLVQRT